MGYVKDLWLAMRFNFFFYLGVITIILLWSWTWGMSFFVLVALLIGASSLKLALNNVKDRFAYLRAARFMFLLAAAFWFLPRFFGWWALFVLLLALAIYKMWKGRAVLMSSIRFVETKLFGKPLDKKKWDAEEKISIYEDTEEKRK